MFQIGLPLFGAFHRADTDTDTQFLFLQLIHDVNTAMRRLTKGIRS